MSTPNRLAEPVERGPSSLERGDRFWWRVLAGSGAGLLLTVVWIVAARALEITVPLPRILAFLVTSQVLFLPAPAGDPEPRYSLRALVVVAVYAATWGAFTVLGFGR